MTKIKSDTAQFLYKNNCTVKNRESNYCYRPKIDIQEINVIFYSENCKFFATNSQYIHNPNKYGTKRHAP